MKCISLTSAQIPVSFFISLALILVFVFGIKLLMQLITATPQSLPRARKTNVYRKRASLMSPPELAFYGVLVQAVEGQYRVFSKVRLLDILDIDPSLSRSEWQSAFNSIQSKHVDFVLCDPVSLSIEGIVELDDSSHARADRQQRDAFVDQSLSAAGIPIFHIPAKQTYSVNAIRSALFNEVKAPSPPPLPGMRM
jgi:hypothetical protein